MDSPGAEAARDDLRLYMAGCVAGIFGWSLEQYSKRLRAKFEISLAAKSLDTWAKRDGVCGELLACLRRNAEQTELVKAWVARARKELA